MESYGEKLKLAREAKKLTVEVVARDTSITRQYIQALETEEEIVFPGEPYLVGFLKNYADYLGLDSGDLIRLYHSKQLQESPVPAELLLKEKPKFLMPLIVVLSVAAVAGLSCFLYFGVFKVPQMREEKAKVIADTTRIHQYSFDGTTQNVRLYKGDQILLPQESGSNVVLTVADTLAALSILTPAGTQVIDLSEERALDVDGDGDSEIILYVSDVSPTDASRGAEVRMLLKSAADGDVSLAYASGTSELRPDDIPVVAGDAKMPVIIEDTRAYPFTLNISFRGQCLFRYRSDNKDVVEDFYHSGDIINVTSNNRFRLWASNINTVKIQVIAGLSTKDLETGTAGAVSVEDIKWIRDPKNGLYRLVVDELD